MKLYYNTSYQDPTLSIPSVVSISFPVIKRRLNGKTRRVLQVKKNMVMGLDRA
jgi:hypothetical protein